MYLKLYIKKIVQLGLHEAGDIFGLHFFFGVGNLGNWPPDFIYPKPRGSQESFGSEFLFRL